jgi:hypothetical protein
MSLYDPESAIKSRVREYVASSPAGRAWTRRRGEWVAHGAPHDVGRRAEGVADRESGDPPPRDEKMNVGARVPVPLSPEWRQGVRSRGRHRALPPGIPASVAPAVGAPSADSSCSLHPRRGDGGGCRRATPRGGIENRWGNEGAGAESGGETGGGHRREAAMEQATQLKSRKQTGYRWGRRRKWGCCRRKRGWRAQVSRLSQGSEQCVIVLRKPGAKQSKHAGQNEDANAPRYTSTPNEQTPISVPTIRVGSASACRRPVVRAELQRAG